MILTKDISQPNTNVYWILVACGLYVGDDVTVQLFRVRVSLYGWLYTKKSLCEDIIIMQYDTYDLLQFHDMM